MARDRDATPPAEHLAPNGWPAAQGQLSVAALDSPPNFGQRRVYLDAGHGAEGNSGNRSAYCEDEQDFTGQMEISKLLDLEIAEPRFIYKFRGGRFSFMKGVKSF